ncbi:MAG: hypothetical protein BHW64_02010 [Candidatus Melainabacteria bacterium LEY3_CP_29_8]|nr:MAG: hypothetical protein BHW64_02010 [Candidatus Melainabacteria bacterium LEY3_CP_29_8]
MNEFLGLLEKSLTKVLKDKTNIIIFILLLGFISSFIKLNEMNKNIIMTKKRVDFRYFNTITMFEELYNIKINTENGELKPKFQSTR